MNAHGEVDIGKLLNRVRDEIMKFENHEKALKEFKVLAFACESLESDKDGLQYCLHRCAKKLTQIDDILHPPEEDY